MLDNGLKGLVLFDEVEGDFGADTFDRINVIAAEENAEIDKLRTVVSFARVTENVCPKTALPDSCPSPTPQALYPGESPGLVLCAVR